MRAGVAKSRGQIGLFGGYTSQWVGVKGNQKEHHFLCVHAKKERKKKLHTHLTQFQDGYLNGYRGGGTLR